MKKTNNELTGANLKNVLWETLHDLKNKKIDSKVANSIAGQSREILRVMKLELAVLSLAQKRPNQKLLGFTEK